MSKFKIKLKIQGFELDVEGSREDIPHLARNLNEQLSTLISPAIALAADGETSDDSAGRVINGTASETTKRKRRKGKTTSTAQNGSEEAALDWKHDPQKWSSPTQSWKAWEKAIWLLHVVSKELSISELSHLQIAATFNKHFKSTKQIQAGNVARDLSNRKSGKDALVGENTTTTPSHWFLTDAGRKAAENLIAGVQE